MKRIINCSPAWFIAYLLLCVSPKVATLVLVTDNLNIHTRKAFYQAFPRRWLATRSIFLCKFFEMQH